ncbi:MAG: YihY family inner membrane protein [Verrucomicrobia bacterium]|nr:YihY family inner membrane protein [Verrucomicrobiota bacterium]MBS0645535.1 YihY family inner membrane protein [Verrucomicrobiota bacterium]
MKKSSYLKRDIWRIQIKQLSRLQAVWIQSLKIIVLVAQGFSKKQIQQGASSLTYYSLIAIVPMITLLLLVTQSILSQDTLQNWLLAHLDEQKILVKNLIAISQKTLSQIHKGFLPSISLILAIWAGIKMLLYIELSMNQTWEVRIGRSFAKRFSDYLAVLFLCPLIVIVSTFFTFLISSAISDLNQDTKIIGDLEPVLYHFFNAIPIVLNCLLLTFLFIFMPNTHVRFLPALYAGILTGLSYQFIQGFYFYLQIGVSRYNTLYGTFAALPLFLIWVHTSWVIILIGSKLAFAFQNVSAYDISDLHITLSRHHSTLLCLRISHLCVRHFYQHQPPLSASQISSELKIPLSLTYALISRLVKAKILCEVTSYSDTEGYQPALPPEEMTIKNVIDMIDSQGEMIEIPQDSDLLMLEKCLDEFSLLLEKSEHNLLLKDF